MHEWNTGWCWCGWDHRYLDYDLDGLPFDVRDVEEEEEDE